MIGPVIILASFQRTHVTTHAVGLVVQYALNLPSDPALPGLGLRRVEWLAGSNNEQSITTAQRLGFRMEGTHRWARVLPDTTPEDIGEGFERQLKQGDQAEGVSLGKGRHDVYLSICWDDWESGSREKLEAQMARRL
jgi:RimJ/RimL family protein N-acetyltransferase